VGFRQPIWLLTLLAVPAIAVLLWAATRVRTRNAVRFAAADMLEGLAPRAGFRKWVPPACLVAAVALGAIAAAGPFRNTTRAKEQATIVLTLDTSLSMMADDVDPTRFAAAKSAATDVIEHTPPQMKVGVVSFAGTAQVVAPPTRDKDRAVQAINALRLQESTAIGEGIMASLDALNSGGDIADAGSAKAILLLSDGETEEGIPSDRAAAEAKRYGVPVYTVAVGRDTTTIEVDGQTAEVHVDEAELRKIAEMTGGQFFRVLDADSLNKVFESIGSRLGVEEVEQSLVPLFVALAAVALVASIALSMVWFGRLA